MRNLLHILIRPPEDLARQIIALQQTQPDTRVEIVDLNLPDPDYSRLLEQIFSADSVQVW